VKLMKKRKIHQTRKKTKLVEMKKLLKGLNHQVLLLKIQMQ
jgi:hypothetical protein